MKNSIMQNESRIYVAGHMGMVGSAIVRERKSLGFCNLILSTRLELDLLDEEAVNNFFNQEKPEYVFSAAAKVGGMKAFVEYPADFLFENLQIQNNIIWSAHKFAVNKLLFLSTSSIYPQGCPQPMQEEYIMTGKVDPSNESYAVAKIAGMELCRMISRQYGRNFISCASTNVYGENDSFDPKSSRIVASLLNRFHQAKLANAPEVEIWGTGEARREFICVKDLAKACIFLMNNFDFSDQLYFVNVGSGEDIKIADLAQLIKETVGYEGKIIWDVSKPEGRSSKLLDVSKINKLGWKSEISLAKGIKEFYNWYNRLDQRR